MDPQEFLKNKIASLGVMVAPIPPAAKMVVNLKGSTPRDNEYNPGPLIKVDGNGIGVRGNDGDYNSISFPKVSGLGALGSLLQ